MRSLLHACLVALPIAFSAGCSSASTPCAPEGTVTVTVTNEVDSNTNYVCNATVTITSVEGGGPQPLTPQGLDGSNVNCVYVVNVSPGRYTLAATASGYAPSSETLGIEQVGCVTGSPSARIALIPVSPSQGDAGLGDGAQVIREAGAGG